MKEILEDDILQGNVEEIGVPGTRGNLMNARLGDATSMGISFYVVSQLPCNSTLWCEWYLVRVYCNLSLILKSRSHPRDVCYVVALSYRH